MPELDDFLLSSAGGLPAARPFARSSSAGPDRSRETAGMPPVESLLEEDVDLSGQTLAGFRIERRIGSGAVGAVYLAEQINLARPVALKVLSGARAASPEYLARFTREARAVARLVHPNAVQVYDVGCADGHHYIALEYVDGQSLSELLERRGKLPWRAALETARQAASSLASAHELGIVHRDIKPENLMISRRGEVKVTDFGLARFGDETSITHHGTILGTPFYMSPEQARGELAGPAADLYALGATLYHAMAGNPPFEGLTVMDVVHKHITEPPRPLAEVDSEIPRSVSDLVARMMAKEPAERPASARELIDLITDARRRAESAGTPESGADSGVIVRQILGPEGRAYSRISSEMVAQARPASLPDHTRKKLAARVSNLSEGGLFMACPAPLAVGTLLELSYRPSEEAEMVEALAVVRWVADEPRGMGLEFVRLSVPERARIRAMAERVEADQAIELCTRTELHRRLLKVCYAETGSRLSLAEVAERAGTSVVMVREGLKPFARHDLARLGESHVEFRPPTNPALAQRIKSWILVNGLSQ